MSDTPRARIRSTLLKTPGRRPYSLKTVLVACLAGVQFVSIFTVMAFVYVAMDRAILQQSRDLLGQHAAAAAARAAQFITPSVQVNETLANLVQSSPANFAANETLERLIYGALRNLPELAGVHFVRADGSFLHVFRSDGGPLIATRSVDRLGGVSTTVVRDEGYMPVRRQVDRLADTDLRKRDWYAAAVATGGQVWTDAHDSAGFGQGSVTLSTPVYLDGTLAGVFGTEIDVRNLGEALHREDVDSRVTTAVLTRDGDVIVHVDGGRTTQFVPSSRLAAFDPVTQRLFARYGPGPGALATDVTVEDGAGQGAVLLSHIEALAAPNPPWLIASHAEQGDLTGGLLSYRRGLFWLLMVPLAVLLFFAVPIANRIMRPLLRFSERSQELARRREEEASRLDAPYTELAPAGQAIVNEVSRRRNLETQYERTFAISARGMARIDPETGRFIHVNGKLCDLLGTTKDRLLTMTLGDVLSRDAEQTLTLLRRAAAEDRNFRIETDFGTPGGKTISLRMAAFVFRDFEGQPDHAFAIFDDNEEARLSAARLENFKRDMNRIARLNLMGQFAAGLAHELNQPLGALVHDVDSALQVLEDATLDTAAGKAELEQILTDIDNHAQRAGDIIRALRNMIVKDDQAPMDFDIVDLLDKTIAIMAPEASAFDVAIETRIPENYVIAGNRVQIAQALVNLIRNAISALSDAPRTDKRIVIEAGMSGGAVRIAVEDNGPGFPEGRKPFAGIDTTKPDGLGLGLSLTKSLVEVNKGAIHHAVGNDGGARFEITLPAKRREGESGDGNPADSVCCR